MLFLPLPFLTIIFKFCPLPEVMDEATAMLIKIEDFLSHKIINTTTAF